MFKNILYSTVFKNQRNNTTLLVLLMRLLVGRGKARSPWDAIYNSILGTLSQIYTSEHNVYDVPSQASNICLITTALYTHTAISKSFGIDQPVYC